MNDTRAPLTAPNDRLLLLLREKRSALSASANGYDAGYAWEAKRIANEIAMLVHDPQRGKTVSLLTQLGLKNKLRMVNSVAGHPIQHAKGEFTPPSGLLGFKGDENGWTVVPTCQTGTIPAEWIAEVKFRRWWEYPVIFFAKGDFLSRKNLVLSARDQDGGAHVDAQIDDEGYVSLSIDVDSRVRFNGHPLKGAHLACVRQIGWEMTETLNRALGELL